MPTEESASEENHKTSSRVLEQDAALLQKQANKARNAYEWEEALRLYSLALAYSGLPAHTEFELRWGRAQCYQYLVDLQASAEDLEIMIALAEANDDKTGRIVSQITLANVKRQSGELAESREKADSARSLAESIGANELAVDAMIAEGIALEYLGDRFRSREVLEQALARARSVDYVAGEASTLRQLGALLAMRFGQPLQARSYLPRFGPN